MRLTRDERGQDIAELTILLPLLLVIVFGIIEFGSIIDSQHAMSYLTREGANIASRGASLDQVLTVTLENGSEMRLDERGGVVVTRVRVEDSMPEVVEQLATSGYGGASRLGGPGDQIATLLGGSLGEGTSVHVVEVFYQRPTLTPFANFFSGSVPETMYDRSVF